MDSERGLGAACAIRIEGERGCVRAWAIAFGGVCALPAASAIGIAVDRRGASQRQRVPVLVPVPVDVHVNGHGHGHGLDAQAPRAIGETTALSAACPHESNSPRPHVATRLVAVSPAERTFCVMKSMKQFAAGVLVAELGFFAFGMGCSSNQNSADPRTPGQKIEDGAKTTGVGIGDAAKQGAKKAQTEANKAGDAIHDAVHPDGGS
jgi:hypothetical protein